MDPTVTKGAARSQNHNEALGLQWGLETGYFLYYYLKTKDFFKIYVYKLQSDYSQNSIYALMIYPHY